MTENNQNNDQSTPSNNAPEEILEEYLKPRTRQTKFWLSVILSVIFIIMALIYKITVIDTTIDPKVLISSMEVINVKSQWIEFEKIDTPDFKGIVLVPEISFQVRNIGKVELNYVFFLGVFRFQDTSKTIGEGFMTAFKKPLKPGQVSDTIVLTSKFGYRASSKTAFSKNAKDWQTAFVNIFARTGAANLKPLKTFTIDRRIEGLDLEIKIINTPVVNTLPNPTPSSPSTK